MSTATKIEWTRGDDGVEGATWNPVTGCVKVSEGCDHCYAATFAERWRGVPGHPFEQGFDLRLWPERLALPLTWRKAKRVFVNSMSDLFIGRDQVPDPFIAAVWATMFWTSPEARGGGWPGASLKPVHTYQILTKRPARMRSWLARWGDRDQRVAMLTEAAELGWADRDDLRQAPWMPAVLPNVWLGVSAEDQRWADVRIPVLLETPATVRFVSAEPLLGPIDLLGRRDETGHRGRLNYWLPPGRPRWGAPYSEPTGPTGLAVQDLTEAPTLDWLIVGGESGPGARPMEEAWARGLVRQCRDSGVAVFVKQLGAVWGRGHGMRGKANDPASWPVDLRVREFPATARRAGAA
ncbi:DUF5131 family protein [Parafrankia sp. FMc6]|uniref:DUF5131 family protein n=1 Tax=Parafrankia soli TaxID=2599596 RepID=UPI0034D760FB